MREMVPEAAEAGTSLWGEGAAIRDNRSIPSPEGSDRSRSVPDPFPSVPHHPLSSIPPPLIHPGCRLEASVWVSAARDALADRQLPHDPRACWELVQAWQPAAPEISQRHVREAHKRLQPYVGAQQALPGVA